MCVRARGHVSVRIDVCKIIRVRVARTRDGIASWPGEGGNGGEVRINRLKLTTYISESAFCADTYNNFVELFSTSRQRRTFSDRAGEHNRSYTPATYYCRFR